MRAIIVSVVLVSAVATARANDVTTTSDHALGLPDRWRDAPLTVEAIAAAGPQVFGHIVGVEADFAPIPWFYISALAGEDQAGLIAGGGIHARAIVDGPVAVSVGARVLHTGARSDTTSDHPFLSATTTTDYSYAPATWSSAELALELRSQDGLQVKLLANLASALAGGDYTFRRTVVDTGLFGSGASTTTHDAGMPSGPQMFVGVAVGFSPRW